MSDYPNVPSVDVSFAQISIVEAEDDGSSVNLNFTTKREEKERKELEQKKKILEGYYAEISTYTVDDGGVLAVQLTSEVTSPLLINF